MSRKRNPQFLPTRRVRGLFEGSLRVLDRIPVLRDFLAASQHVESSDVPLSILMPLHLKDLWIAKAAISYAKKNLRHPLEEIVIVSAHVEEIQNWAKEEGYRWLNEDELTSWNREEISSRLPSHAKDRNRWIFQQLIKLAGNRFMRTDAFLILDADTLMLTPRVFKSGETIWMDFSHERNLLYLKAYEKLLGEKPHSFISFVCHHIVCEKHILEELKAQIEKESGLAWDDAIVDMAVSDIWSEKEKAVHPFNYFSEYETYGNYLWKYHRDVRLRYFRNHSAREFDPEELDIDAYVSELPKFFQWASFHSYHSKATKQTKD